MYIYIHIYIYRERENVYIHTLCVYTDGAPADSRPPPAAGGPQRRPRPRAARRSILPPADALSGMKCTLFCAEQLPADKWSDSSRWQLCANFNLYTPQLEPLETTLQWALQFTPY